MEFSLYNLVYMFTNAFDVYIVYRLMKILFFNRSINKNMTIIAYSFRYLVTTVVYIFIPYPIISVISSLITIFIVTLCYESKLTKKIISTLLTYLTMFIAEAVVAAFIGISNLSPFMKSQQGNGFSLVMVQIFALIITTILGKFKSLRSDTSMPWTFTITALLVSLISVFFEIRVFMQENISNLVYFLSIVCVLLLNFIIFYLYDSLSKSFNEKMQTEFAKREIVYYRNQSEIIQKNTYELKQFRHDIKNHIIVIEQLIKQQKTEEALEYLSKLTSNLTSTNVYSSTGNFAIDSIINYKLSKAANLGIKITANIVIPEDLKLNEDDFIVILGNLLDNSIEATSKLSDNKYIKLNVEYDKGTIFIAVKNSFDGKVNIKDNVYETTKDDKQLHGIGLQSIESSIKKYNGEMIIKYNKNEFYTKILMMN